MTYQYRNICKMYLTANALYCLLVNWLALIWFNLHDGAVHVRVNILQLSLLEMFRRYKFHRYKTNCYDSNLFCSCNVNKHLFARRVAGILQAESQVKEVITWMFWSPHHKLGVSKCMVLKTIYYTVKIHNYVNLVRMTCEGLPVQ